LKFRKKPIVIKATQWHKIGDHPMVDYYRNPNLGGQNMCQRCKKHILRLHGWIDTLEGGHTVCPTDWIITGIAGEGYPVKDFIFQKTYERVEE